MKDTDPKTVTIFEKMFLSQSGVERLRMASSMHATAKAMVMASLRGKYPRAPEAHLRGLLFLRFYKDDFPIEEQNKIYRHLTAFNSKSQ